MYQLSKKDRKHVSKLITKKLMELGVKDEITFVKSGKLRMDYKRDNRTGQIETEIQDGKRVPKLVKTEMLIAMNVLRRTVREMRKQSPEVIEAFLNMSSPVAGQ